jgi:hypothetical protein
LIDGEAATPGLVTPGPNPIKVYRHFGLLVGGIFVAIGLWPLLLRAQPVRLIPLLVGAALAALAAVAPRTLKPAFRMWMALGAVLGWINTRVILAFAFYVIFTPLGLVLRLCGKDPIRRVVQDDSYRLARAPRPGSHMMRQF